MDLLDRLLEHDDWATKQLLSLSAGLSDEQLDREFDIGNRTLRATFDHIILNTDFWMGVMTGERIAYERAPSSLATLVADHERSYSAFSAFARRTRDEGRMEQTFVDHWEQPMRFGGAIVHVIMHNEDHRTEAVHILTRLGLDPAPEVDHGLWDFHDRGLVE
jgi:uncharacterized damage-inducible protein DinB